MIINRKPKDDYLLSKTLSTSLAQLQKVHFYYGCYCAAAHGRAWAIKSEFRVLLLSSWADQLQDYLIPLTIFSVMAIILSLQI
jgi:hypothetical protein